MRLGGIPQMNTFSKLYLALLGVFPWKYLPSIPVEMVLLRSWAPFHIYKMSSWSRAMLIPLAIINHFKPTRILPGEKQLHELYPLGTEQADLRLPRSEKFWTWRNFFLRVDDTFKFLQPLRIGLLRQRALEAAERWMLERIREGSDGLAAVYPAMLNCMQLAIWISAAPDPQRSALALFYLDEFDYREILDIAELKLSELSRFLAKGRRQLQACACIRSKKIHARGVVCCKSCFDRAAPRQCCHTCIAYAIHRRH